MMKKSLFLFVAYLMLLSGNLFAQERTKLELHFQHEYEINGTMNRFRNAFLPTMMYTITNRGTNERSEGVFQGGISDDGIFELEIEGELDENSEYFLSMFDQESAMSYHSDIYSESGRRLAYLEGNPMAETRFQIKFIDYATGLIIPNFSIRCYVQLPPHRDINQTEFDYYDNDKRTQTDKDGLLTVSKALVGLTRIDFNNSEYEFVKAEGDLNGLFSPGIYTVQFSIDPPHYNFERKNEGTVYLRKRGTLPKLIPLHYIQRDYRNNRTSEYEHMAVRIGEYYWMDRNFSQDIPTGLSYWGNAGLLTGDENSIPMSQSIIDKYMPLVHLNPQDYKVNINDFEKYFGRYYARISFVYMLDYGTMYEGDDRKNLLTSAGEKAWNLPHKEDFHQLFGMCPANWVGTHLHEIDVRTTLSCKRGDNPLTTPTIGGQHTGDRVYWFDNNTNKYGFNLMPGGARLNEGGIWGTNIHGVNVGFQGSKGDLYQLFYTARFHLHANNTMIIHDWLTPETTSQWHWQNVRWCRKLTEAELGYRLYINKTNYNETYDYHLNLDVTNLNIVKTGLDEAAPSGYIPLQKGYLRGFYVQYILDNPNPVKSMYDVALLAKNTIVYHLNPNNGKKTEAEAMVQTKQAKASLAALIEESKGVELYPSPVIDVLNIQSSEKVMSLKVYSTAGKLVESLNNVGSEINMSSYPSGFYIIKIQTETDNYTHKIMKK